MRRTIVRTTLLGAALFALACAKKEEAPKMDSAVMAPPAAATLYDKLGGKTAITAVVDALVGNVAGDKRINKFFGRVAGDTAAMSAFKGKLVDQVCQAAGGPCTYTGLDMKKTHAGMKLQDKDFDALVEDLVAALDKLGVGAAEKDALLGALGPMRADIVTKK